MTTSNAVRSISSGFGVSVNMDSPVPDIVEDYVASNFSMLRTTPIEGVECAFFTDQGITAPVKVTIADCVIYPSIRAGSGNLDTQVVVTAGVKVLSAPTITSNQQVIPLNTPPVIGVLLTPKYYPTNTSTQRILSSQVTEMPGYLITSQTGQIFQQISNSDDVGYTVAGVMTLPDNFEGRIELEMSFDVDACYTADEYTAVAASQEIELTVEQLKSAICVWAEQNVRLDILDATARVLCTFRGE
jgi:hypothetical protein